MIKNTPNFKQDLDLNKMRNQIGNSSGNPKKETLLNRLNLKNLLLAGVVVGSLGLSYSSVNKQITIQNSTPSCEISAEEYFKIQNPSDYGFNSLEELRGNSFPNMFRDKYTINNSCPEEISGISYVVGGSADPNLQSSKNSFEPNWNLVSK